MPDAFRASFIETRSGRSVEILAEAKSTTVLIASKGWSGDLDKSLIYETGDQATHKSVQTTCASAAASGTSAELE